MNITTQYLKKWLQSEFMGLGINMIVKSGYKTRFRGQDYESGACTYIFLVGTKDSDTNATVLCFLPKSELEWALNNGKKLYWKPRDRFCINDSEISYR